MTTYRFILENGMEYSANAATMQDAIAYGKNKFTGIFSVQVDPTQSNHWSLDTAPAHEQPKYNGWTNWETWQILLWIDNDEQLYRMTRDFVRRSRYAHSLQFLVEGWVRHLFPDGTPDMDSADEFDCVNWEEITTHLVEEHDNDNEQ